MQPQDELVAACHTGDIVRMQAALRGGARVAEEDASGVTPLRIAVLSGHSEVALGLLDAGAEQHRRLRQLRDNIREISRRLMLNDEDEDGTVGGSGRVHCPSCGEAMGGVAGRVRQLSLSPSQADADAHLNYQLTHGGHHPEPIGGATSTPYRSSTGVSSSNWEPVTPSFGTGNGGSGGADPSFSLPLHGTFGAPLPSASPLHSLFINNGYYGGAPSGVPHGVSDVGPVMYDSSVNVTPSGSGMVTSLLEASSAPTLRGGAGSRYHPHHPHHHHHHHHHRRHQGGIPPPAAPVTPVRNRAGLFGVSGGSTHSEWGQRPGGDLPSWADSRGPNTQGGRERADSAAASICGALVGDSLAAEDLGIREGLFHSSDSPAHATCNAPFPYYGALGEPSTPGQQLSVEESIAIQTRSPEEIHEHMRPIIAGVLPGSPTDPQKPQHQQPQGKVGSQPRVPLSTAGTRSPSPPEWTRRSQNPVVATPGLQQKQEKKQQEHVASQAMDGSGVEGGMGEKRGVGRGSSPGSFPPRSSSAPSHAAVPLSDSSVAKRIVAMERHDRVRDGLVLLQRHLGRLHVPCRQWSTVESCARGKASALHVACAMGEKGIVQALLSAGAGVHRRDLHSTFPLHHAASAGSISIVKLLLARGARVTAYDKNKAPALFRAVAAGDLAMTRFFLESSAPADVCDRHLQTALHFAARHGFTAIAKLLFKYGGKVSAKCRRSRLPLHMASMFGHVETVRFLVDSGEPELLSAEDRDGFTPLGLAVLYDHTSTGDLIRKRAALAGVCPCGENMPTKASELPPPSNAMGGGLSVLAASVKKRKAAETAAYLPEDPQETEPMVSSPGTATSSVKNGPIPAPSPPSLQDPSPAGNRNRRRRRGKKKVSQKR